MTGLSNQSQSRPPDYSLPCDVCGPQCTTEINQKRKVVGVWETDGGYQRTYCIRCGARGSTKKSAEVAAARVQPIAKDNSSTARWLWSKARPLSGTFGEEYLRRERHLDLQDWPSTMRFLPSNGTYPAAIVTAFGVADGEHISSMELEKRVTAVHLTKLTEQGEKLQKIMLGPVSGQPLCLAPYNNKSEMIIAEGIEDALSLYMVTGVCVWAAGSAVNLPKLVSNIPCQIENITVVADIDEVGLKNSRKLVSALKNLGHSAVLLQIRGGGMQ